MNIQRLTFGIQPSRSLLPLLLLVALAGVCFAKLLANPSALIVDGRRPSLDYANPGDSRPIGNDLTFLFLPHHLFISKTIAETGHWPMWDPTGFGGRPMVGNPQSGMFYPPTWIAWYTGIPAVLGWLTIAHLIWGGLGTFALARVSGQTRLASTVAAGCFQASPYLMGHVFEGHYPHIWGVCWFPWAFWAFDSRRLKSLRGIVTLPLFMSMVFIVGHPQEGFLLGLALCFRTFVDWTRSRQHEGVLVRWTGVMIIALGISALDLAPQFANRPWKLQDAQTANPAAEIPTHYSLRLINALELISPEALGGPADFDGYDNSWETKLSFGLLPLILAIAAIRLHPDQQTVRGWLLLALLTIWVACGYKLGLFALIYHLVPGMNLFRVPARPLFLTSLAIAILAGFGVDALKSAVDWRRLGQILLLMFLLVSGIYGIVRLSTGPKGLTELKSVENATAVAPRANETEPAPADGIASELPPSRTRGWSREQRAIARVVADTRLWILTAALGVLVALGSFQGRWNHQRILASSLGLIAFVELAYWGYTLIQVSSPWEFLGPDPVAEIVAHARPSSGRAPIRLKTRDSFYGDLRAIWNGFEKTNIDDSFQLKHAALLYEQLYSVASRPRLRLPEAPMDRAVEVYQHSIRQRVFDLMSVEFVVSNRVEPGLDWPVYQTGPWDKHTSYVLQENPTALPRAYVVGRARIMEPEPALVLSTLESTDPRQQVLMLEDPLAGLSSVAGSRQPFTPAEWLSHDPDHIRLKVTTEKPGLLVIADTWMPGWSAFVDGKPVEVQRGNFAQRVIPLQEPGDHVIHLDYSPPGLILALVLFLGALVLWGLLCLRIARRLRASPTPIHDASAATIPA